ncbi:ribosome recycling factor-domain-containing protein [Cadophora sp. MPI-SDFR-AT-0126]|nr:ribosome recycling factor-domain-containing protein [Leotiomycetes sp. MPI-SDFR-AT-0126]
MPPILPVRVYVLRQLLPKYTARTECQLILKTITLSQKVPAISPPRVTSRRHFSQTPLLLKKKGRADREEAASSQTTEVEDPYDFSTLESSIEKVLEKLKNDLSKLRTGGRFNPEVLENLRVHLVKDSKATEKLGDLAQVLPKGGRSLMILVGEKDHVKPIISAIQGSKDLNLQPVQDAKNAAQLNVPIPPPTKESRDLALGAASKTGETANVGIRNARGAMQKRLRAMEIKKTIRPDDLKKASKEMEKIVEKAVADVKKTVDAARKGMEQA